LNAELKVTADLARYPEPDDSNADRDALLVENRPPDLRTPRLAWVEAAEEGARPPGSSGSVQLALAPISVVSPRTLMAMTSTRDELVLVSVAAGQPWNPAPTTWVPQPIVDGFAVKVAFAAPAGAPAGTANRTTARLPLYHLCSSTSALSCPFG